MNLFSSFRNFINPSFDPPESDNLKVVDYPRGKYWAYWEISSSPVPGGFSATIQFYPHAGHTINPENSTFVIVEPSAGRLQTRINKFLKTQMETYRR